MTDQPGFRRRHPNAVFAKCDLCPAEAKWTRGGSRYCDDHADADPTGDQPDLCCEHGAEILERLDRILDLMQEAQDARTTKLAIGGPVPEGGTVVGGTGCVVQAAQLQNSGPFVNFEVAQAIADATINELDRQGRLRP